MNSIKKIIFFCCGVLLPLGASAQETGRWLCKEYSRIIVINELFEKVKEQTGFNVSPTKEGCLNADVRKVCNFRKSSIMPQGDPACENDKQIPLYEERLQPDVSFNHLSYVTSILSKNNDEICHFNFGISWLVRPGESKTDGKFYGLNCESWSERKKQILQEEGKRGLLKYCEKFNLKCED